MTTEDYLTAFDGWLSHHIHVAVKSGRDLAFRDRRFNCSLKLDDDGSAWDYLLIEPGTAPPPGHAWTVYRLHGLTEPPAEPIVVPHPLMAKRRRDFIDSMAEIVFGQGGAPWARVSRPDSVGCSQLRP